MYTHRGQARAAFLVQMQAVDGEAFQVIAPGRRQFYVRMPVSPGKNKAAQNQQQDPASPATRASESCLFAPHFHGSSTSTSPMPTML